MSKKWTKEEMEECTQIILPTDSSEQFSWRCDVLGRKLGRSPKAIRRMLWHLAIGHQYLRLKRKPSARPWTYGEELFVKWAATTVSANSKGFVTCEYIAGILGRYICDVDGCAKQYRRESNDWHPC